MLDTNITKIMAIVHLKIFLFIFEKQGNNESVSKGK